MKKGDEKMWSVICKETIGKTSVTQWYVCRYISLWNALKTAMWFNHSLYKKQKDYSRVYFIRKEKKNA